MMYRWKRGLLPALLVLLLMLNLLFIPHPHLRAETMEPPPVTDEVETTPEETPPPELETQTAEEETDLTDGTSEAPTEPPTSPVEGTAPPETAPPLNIAPPPPPLDAPFSLSPFFWDGSAFQPLDENHLPALALADTEGQNKSLPLQLLFRVHFPLSVEKKISVSLANGLVWLDDGASKVAPFDALLSLGERQDATIVDGQPAADGRYDYFFSDESRDVELLITVARDLALPTTEGLAALLMSASFLQEGMPQERSWFMPVPPMTETGPQRAGEGPSASLELVSEWMDGSGNPVAFDAATPTPYIGDIGKIASEVLEMRFTVHFPAGSEKSLKLSLADGLEWVDNGASSAPAGILASVSVLAEQSTIYGQLIQNGSYRYRFLDGVNTATIAIKVKQLLADNYVSQADAVQAEASCKNSAGEPETLRHLLPRIDFSTWKGSLGQRSNSSQVALDKVVFQPYALATISNLYVPSSVLRFFNSATVLVQAPEHAVPKRSGTQGLGIPAAIDRCWTVAPEPLSTEGGVSTWEFKLSEGFASVLLYFAPCWEFPSAHFAAGQTLEIVPKEFRWRYYGDESEHVVSLNATTKDVYRLSASEEIFVCADPLGTATSGVRTHDITWAHPEHMDASGCLGTYTFGNRGAADSAPKYVQFDFDTSKIGVDGILLCGETGQPLQGLQYKLVGDLDWRTAPELGKRFGTAVTLGLGSTTFSASELGLAAGQTFASLRYELNFLDAATNTSYGVRAGTRVPSGASIFGQIKDGNAGWNVNSSVSIYDVADPANVVSGTVQHYVRNATVSTLHTTLAYDRIRLAGQTLNFRAWISSQQYWTDSSSYFCKTPIFYIRDETGLGISNVKLTNAQNVELLSRYQLQAVLDHEETVDHNGDGKLAKVYKIDTTPLNTQAAWADRYAAAVGIFEPGNWLHRSLRLDWDVKLPGDYNDGGKLHLNREVVYAVDPRATSLGGDMGSIGDPFDVDGDGQIGAADRLVVGATRSNNNFYQIKGRGDIVVTTASKLATGGSYQVWDASKPYIVVDFTENYLVKTSLSNNSGIVTSSDPANATVLYIPIPKKGEQWGELNRGKKGDGTELDSFGFTSVLAAAVANPDAAVYSIDYAELDSSAIGAGWSASQVGNYLRGLPPSSWSSSFNSNANMLRITGVAIPNAVPADFVLELSSAVAGNEEQAVNIYAPLYWQDLTNAQGEVYRTWQKGSLIGTQLVRGRIKGQVFVDSNLDGIWSAGESAAAEANFSGWQLDVYDAADPDTSIRSLTLTAAGQFEVATLSRGAKYILRLSNPDNASWYFSKTNAAYAATGVSTVGSSNFFVGQAGQASAQAQNVYAVDLPGTVDADRPDKGNGIYNVGLSNHQTSWTLYSAGAYGSFTNSRDNPPVIYKDAQENKIEDGIWQSVGNVTVSASAGYAFKGWARYTGSASEWAALSAAEKQALSLPASMPSIAYAQVGAALQLGTEDQILYAVYQAENYGYSVSYYLEQADGSFSEDLAAKVSGSQAFGSSLSKDAAGVLKSFDGYHYDHADPSGGSLVIGTTPAANVLKLYYLRQTFQLSYAYTGSVPSGAPTLPTTSSHRWGETVSLAARPTLEGYGFVGWLQDGAALSSVTMPKADASVTGSFAANAYDYSVSYYLEQADGSFTEDSGLELSSAALFGTTVDTDTAGVKKEIPAYRYDHGDPASVSISEDASANHLKLYYKRALYRVVYLAEGLTSGAVPADPKSYAIGDTVVVLGGDMGKTGYLFQHWKVNPELKPGDSLLLDAGILALARDAVIHLEAVWTALPSTPTSGPGDEPQKPWIASDSALKPLIPYPIAASKIPSTSVSAARSIPKTGERRGAGYGWAALALALAALLVLSRRGMKG